MPVPLPQVQPPMTVKWIRIMLPDTIDLFMFGDSPESFILEQTSTAAVLPLPLISIYVHTPHVKDADASTSQSRCNTIRHEAWRCSRWVELMPKAELTYTEKRAEYGDNKEDERTEVMVNVGDVDDDAARWWAAVLSPGEGWQAYLTWEGTKFLSPWSTALETRVKFTLSCRKPLWHTSTTAPSFATALRFLAEYCNLHNIAGQTLAALSSTLFLPLLNTKKNPTSLPKPDTHKRQRLKPPVSEPTEQRPLDFILEQIVPELDKLLTLSCNARGLRSLLSSVFYEPGIPCNVVSPWLQSTFAVLDSVEDDHLLAQILMNRVPQVSFLLAWRYNSRHPTINTPIRYEALNLEEESASENATRIIFGWLRIDGYPPRERGISNHEWMNVDESDNESPPPNESPRSHAATTSKAVEDWIQQSILVPDSVDSSQI
ncbi:predicted protein [Uncinocarpus reesii 1704]|uniref:Uncharacterized protein n=1 Tax=Uncinocarpus reesii (strain UAMH 1704) TaxID=336963 RepID=C4JW37_UNCRE|nr:uncharacterized protein UREG_06779 [Uncinocarpus reesii 1704]EEP81914.1 predicted protein [Uncinocarpus reesii 1704]